MDWNKKNKNTLLFLNTRGVRRKINKKNVNLSLILSFL